MIKTVCCWRWGSFLTPWSPTTGQSLCYHVPMYLELISPFNKCLIEYSVYVMCQVLTECSQYESNYMFRFLEIKVVVEYCFSVAVIKCPDKKQVRKDRVCFGLQFQRWFGSSWQRWHRSRSMNPVLQLGSGEITFHLHTGNRENRKWEPDYKFSKPALSDVLLSVGLDNLTIHNLLNCATSRDEMLKYMGLWGSISHSNHHSCYTYLIT